MLSVYRPHHTQLWQRNTVKIVDERGITVMLRLDQHGGVSWYEDGDQCCSHVLRLSFNAETKELVCTKKAVVPRTSAPVVQVEEVASVKEEEPGVHGLSGSLSAVEDESHRSVVIADPTGLDLDAVLASIAIMSRAAGIELDGFPSIPEPEPEPEVVSAVSIGLGQQPEPGEGFKVDDEVMWIGADVEVPKYSTGKIIGKAKSGRLRVQFETGTWAFDDIDLMLVPVVESARMGMYAEIGKHLVSFRENLALDVTDELESKRGFLDVLNRMVSDHEGCIVSAQEIKLRERILKKAETLTATKAGSGLAQEQEQEQEEEKEQQTQEIREPDKALPVRWRSSLSHLCVCRPADGVGHPSQLVKISNVFITIAGAVL